MAGFSTQKLTLQWPSDVNSPSELSNFESVARTLRFQALGRACRDAGVRLLLFGHHRNDEAELLLTRLSTRASLFRAFQSPTSRTAPNIPECNGIFGVHESDSDCWWASSNPSRSHPFAFLPVQKGGIRIAHPLHSFTKDRLVETCKSNDIQWFEDDTNSDPTLTRRNAIRHIVKNFKLPNALTENRLIESKNRATKRGTVILRVAEELLDKTSMSLETRIGCLTVQLPCDKVIAHLKAEVNQETGLMWELIKHSFVRNLAYIVSPTEMPGLGSFRLAASRLFHADATEVMSPETNNTFTAGGALFRPQRDKNGAEIWVISRQPPWKQEAAHSIPLDLLPDSEPVLFDNRFWIATECDSAPVHALELRFLRESDLGRLSHQHKKLMAHYHRSPGIPDMLRQLAPGPIRLTLPVIALRNDLPRDALSGMEDEASKLLQPGDVVAFPSLGLSLRPCFEGEWSWLQQLKYKASYRKVHLGSHKARDVVVRDNTWVQKTIWHQPNMDMR